MQFPESWLRAFCNPPLNTQELANVLTMGGFEVEEVRPAAPAFTHVVVGEIVEAKPHANSDHLRVCRVNVGADAPLNIVCGAPNARAGIKVPCALVGAELPAAADGKPFVIKAAKLRGVESHGMLCSARELGLSEDHSGLLELSLELAPGRDIRAALNLDEALFNVKLTPNLGHALSVYGLARELAALTGAPLKTPIHAPVPASTPEVLPIKVSASDLCGRFSGRVVRHLNTQAATPGWMVERLARCGQRSVSALVDISNYVMFEYGRPTHIFDLAKIDGGLDVRWGRKGEQLELLNGSTVSVDETVGVIADRHGLESLAGIMGGEATAVSDSTRDIYIEAAFWWPAAIAGRPRRFNFGTEAGYRFERGVDAATTVEHLERITALVLDVCGTPETVCGVVGDQQPNLPKRAPVTFRVARAAKVIGVPITADQCAEAFQRLAFNFRQAGDVFTVTPPSWRFDLTIEEDLIEEIARIVGYQQLPDAAPVARLIPSARSESRLSAFDVRHTLADLGYHETINFSFVEAAWERDLTDNRDPIRLLNPIASPLAVMRSSLLGSLLQVVQHNVQRRSGEVRVFEIGRVFTRDATVTTTSASVRGVRQPFHVAAILYGPRARQGWEGRQKPADFYDVKGDVEVLIGRGGATFEPATQPAFHPGRCARVLLRGQAIGYVGELHPRWRQQWELPHAPVMFELQLDALLERQLPAAEPLPRQLPVERDIAVVVREQITHDQLASAAHAAVPRDQLLDVTLFDIYRPNAVAGQNTGVAAGEKSAALRLTLSGTGDDALTDAGIDALVARVVRQLAQDCGARLRS
jgi:phenylalanyl-tRNA synthetase beta chain